MAKDKRSFVLYADQLSMVDKLPDDKAGQLFKLILAYVNDKNPETDDLLLQVAFEPVKQQLKRDLKKYEKKKKQWSDAGKKSAAKRSAKSTDVERALTTDEKIERPSTVNDNVSVNVNDNVINSLNLSELEQNLELLYQSQKWKEAVCKNQKLTILEFEKVFQHFKAKVITAGEMKTVGMLQGYFASYLPKYREEILTEKKSKTAPVTKQGYGT